jgi:hypothetical protein
MYPHVYYSIEYLVYGISPGDKENTHTHTHTGVLFSHKEEQNYVIFRKMDGTGNYFVN